MPPKAPPTHFLCIPLQAPQLARTLTSFTADITSPNSFAIPEAAVRPFGTLHLTLGVMSLRDEVGVKQAGDLLRGLRLKGLWGQAQTQTNGGLMGDGKDEIDGKSGRPRVTLKGLKAMQKPSTTSVLYTPPLDPSNSLHNFCSSLRQPFLDTSLMSDEGRPLLLHATIINTIYVKGRGKKRMMIDAREVLGRYGEDYVWLEDWSVDKVRICRMGAKETEDGGVEYEVEAEVGFEEEL